MPKIIKASYDSASHYFLIVQKDKRPAQDLMSFMLSKYV